MGEVLKGGEEGLAGKKAFTRQGAGLPESAGVPPLDVEVAHLQEDPFEASSKLGWGRSAGEQIPSFLLQGMEGEREENLAQAVEPKIQVTGVAAQPMGDGP